MFRRVLVAFDGSPGAHRALEAAVDLARSEGAELIGVAIEAHLAHYGATVGQVEEERLVEEADARRLLAEARRLGQQRDEALHPPVDGHLIDVDTPLSEHEGLGREPETANADMGTRCARGPPGDPIRPVSPPGPPRAQRNSAARTDQLIMGDVAPILSTQLFSLKSWHEGR